MAFAPAYSTRKRPKTIGPDGEEEYPEDAGRWRLHAAADGALARRAAAEVAGAAGAGAAGAEAAAAGPAAAPTPQRVVDQLLAARGELDVLLDLVNAVEARQFVTAAHAPAAPDPAAAAREARLRLARRRAALAAAAARLRAGADALAARAARDAAFLEEVAELGRAWRLARRGGGAAAEVGYLADFSLCLRGAAAEGVEQVGAALAVVADGEGRACAAVPAPGGGRRAARGAAAVGAALAALQDALAWRVVEQLLARDAARATRAAADADGAVAALRRMARAAARRAAAAAGGAAAGGAAAEAPLPPPRAPADPELRPAAAADVAAFCAAPAAQPLFEAAALRSLAALLRAGAEPSLAAEARGSAPPTGVLAELAAWLRHAALRRAAGAALAAQAAARGVVLAGPDAGGGARLRAVWRVSKAGGAFCGALVADGAELRWEGGGGGGGGGGAPSGPVGRRQLATLLDRACPAE
jgi:hypothetical protein